MQLKHIEILSSGYSGDRNAKDKSFKLEMGRIIEVGRYGTKEDSPVCLRVRILLQINENQEDITQEKSTLTRLEIAFIFFDETLESLIRNDNVEERTRFKGETVSWVGDVVYNTVRGMAFMEWRGTILNEFMLPMIPNGSFFDDITLDDSFWNVASITPTN